MALLPTHLLDTQGNMLARSCFYSAVLFAMVMASDSAQHQGPPLMPEVFK
jgi:hypothetical protein